MTTKVVNSDVDDDHDRQCHTDEVAGFSSRLDRLRQHLGGLSMRKLEERCHINRGTLQAAHERGSTTTENLALLRKHTGVDLNWLVCGKNMAGADDDGLAAVPAAEHEALVRATKREKRRTEESGADRPSGRFGRSDPDR